jgi:hypothetical protein
LARGTCCVAEPPATAGALVFRVRASPDDGRADAAEIGPTFFFGPRSAARAALASHLAAGRRPIKAEPEPEGDATAVRRLRTEACIGRLPGRRGYTCRPCVSCARAPAGLRWSRRHVNIHVV